MRELSPSCFEFLKAVEGLRLNQYRDVAGHLTIGYGHKIKPGEAFATITREQAGMIYEQDLRPARIAVSTHVHVPLTDNEYGALVSLCFNIGSGGFRDSTLVKRLNKGEDKAKVAQEEFPRWNKITKTVNGVSIKVESPGLTNRRKKDLALFLKP